MFDKKALCEAAWKEADRRKRGKEKWVSSRKISEKDAALSIAKMETIYRILCRLSDSDIESAQK